MAEENGRANAVGNDVYTALPLTRYPEAIDSRTGAGQNNNMLLWKNLENYNMSEHVNAIADAVMSIQRALGISPQLPTTVKDQNGNVITDRTALVQMMQVNTVKSRLDGIENKNFDTRYGGPNWKTTDKQTIQEHKHTGKGPGHPSKIDLELEAQGQLPRANMDLVYNSPTGLTGANIALNTEGNQTISAAFKDSLSKSAGGTVQKFAEFEGKMWTRWNRDYDVTDLTGDEIADSDTLLNLCKYKNQTAAHTFISKKFDNMYYGRYVMIVRAKTNSRVDANLLKLATIAQTGDLSESATFKGTDFKAVDVWQNFYLVLNHEPNTTSGTGQFLVEKATTSAAVKVSVDYVLITPVHPAVFDR